MSIGGDLPTPEPRLLLVEDARPVREALSESLTAAGFEVDTAETATRALEWLSTRRYAAIVADWVLPDLSPSDWLATIRGAAPTTPVVLYSGAIAPDDLQQFARSWKVAAVLTKPFPLAQLVATVWEAIHSRADGGRRP
jgi:DNA-binding response OmpR family regulator